jgi:ribosomal protein S18 acetylase RimI-like enzyme
MSAAGLISARQPFSGLRPFQPRRDLADMADLVEICFAATLDAAGRSAIQDMRLLNRSGPLLWLLARLNKTIPLMRGFVWIERDRLVGNVSLAPAGYDGGWVIANVAVYPEYRRRGIARRLMQAALEWVDQKDASVILQVDADNGAAQALYESLGFEEQRAFTRWRRVGYLRSPAYPLDLPSIRRLKPSEAIRLYDLAAHVRPDARGGMGWLRPTRPSDFRPAWRGMLHFLLSGQRTDFWIVPGEGGQIDGALRLESRIGGLSTAFDLLVHPARQGELEAPLMNILLSQLVGRRDPLVTEHPADDTAASDVFQHNNFRAERTLVHMLRPREQTRAEKESV